jgi:hypothetical protein
MASYHSYRISARIKREAHQEAVDRIAEGVTGETGESEVVSPMVVPEILRTTGGYAVIVENRVEDVYPYNDVWKDGK